MNTSPNISLQSPGISAGDTPRCIDTPNGYFGAGKMHYYVKDYQGNVRQVTDADGNVEQDNHYYPYGMLMAESSDILAAAGSSNTNPYLFGSKEYLTTAGANLLDFTARTYDPSTLLFQTQDPNSGDYTPFLPYLYCGSDPVNRIDPDGKEWIIEQSKDGKRINLRLTGAVINTSSKEFDLEKVAKAIAKQLNDVYTFSNDEISVTMSAEIRAVASADEIEFDDHVFNIVDAPKPNKKNVPATTNNYGGLEIKLSAKLVSETLAGNNKRTIAHEVGHSGGLHHTNSAKFKDTNLMTQISYLSKDINKNDAIHLQTYQIKEIIKNYKSGNLDLYSPLKERYSPKFINRWPFFKISEKYLKR